VPPETPPENTTRKGLDAGYKESKLRKRIRKEIHTFEESICALQKAQKTCTKCGKKNWNFKKNIKAVKKEVIMNIHTVKDHQRKATVLAVETVAMTVAVAVAAAARGRGNGRGSGRDSGCCGWVVAAVAELWLLWLSCGCCGWVVAAVAELWLLWLNCGCCGRESSWELMTNLALCLVLTNLPKCWHNSSQPIRASDHHPFLSIFSANHSPAPPSFLGQLFSQSQPSTSFLFRYIPALYYKKKKKKKKKTTRYRLS
jgi:hypothetical protein